MKVYVKYKTKIQYDYFNFYSIEFKIKLRSEKEKYKTFGYTLKRYLNVNDWNEIRQTLEGEGMRNLIEQYVRNYFYNANKNKLNDTSKEKVELLMNKKWKEIELIIE